MQQPDLQQLPFTQQFICAQQIAAAEHLPFTQQLPFVQQLPLVQQFPAAQQFAVMQQLASEAVARRAAVALTDSVFTVAECLLFRTATGDLERLVSAADAAVCDTQNTATKAINRTLSVCTNLDTGIDFLLKIKANGDEAADRQLKVVKCRVRRH